MNKKNLIDFLTKKYKKSNNLIEEDAIDDLALIIENCNNQELKEIVEDRMLLHEKILSNCKSSEYTIVYCEKTISLCNKLLILI